ncbi:MAG: class C sortase [Propionibacteriaceae bacterium]|jgi:sortase A|nr:class C sortase [Propionibacteriaceae bacterium]
MSLNFKHLALSFWKGVRENWLICLVGVVGVAMLAYPTAGCWFAERAQGEVISSYIEEMETHPTSELQAIIEAAHRYNEKLPYDVPIAEAAVGKQLKTKAAYADYLDQMKIGPAEAIGRVRIKSIEADLPMFHGTSEKAISSGAGHMYGSSLPVGGEGTHAVLTAHSGLVNAELFTKLEKVRIGDVVTILVGTEELYYEVDDIATVLPTQTEALKIEPGKDLLTLMTCTPIGVNSHRLLVTGHRKWPVTAELAGSYGMPKAPDGGFPWWIPAFMFGALALGVFVVAVTNPRKQRAKTVGKHMTLGSMSEEELQSA